MGTEQETEIAQETKIAQAAKGQKTTETPPQKTDRKKAKSNKRRSLAEWITLSISTLVLTLIVGLVLYDWQLSKNLPPAFQIEVTEKARLTAGRYYVPFTLRNTGGRIARTVQVIAELDLPDGTAESGEQQFDFLSGNERKKGSFVFEHNPQDGTLVIRVASFGLP
ncbi:MAG: TIGR02588 family protein [Phormidesmis sp.]